MNVTTSIPDGLSLQTGDEIQFQALVKQDGTLQVMRVLHRETPKSVDQKPRMTLGEWARKWGGTFKLAEGETVEDVRRAAVRRKYGV